MKRIMALVLGLAAACVDPGLDVTTGSAAHHGEEEATGPGAGGIDLDLPRPADPMDKMDPVLRLAVEHHRESPRLFPLYILTSNPSAAREALEAGGGRWGTVSGDVVTGRVAARGLEGIALLPSVLEMEAAAKVKLRLDQSRVSTRAAMVHAGSMPLMRAYTGRGVVAAIIDAGLDLSHQAFRNADGSSRVRALWDQDGMGTPPMGFNYGQLCSNTDINNNACNHAVEATHGTHVAGITAGSNVMGQPYAGFAPESDIVYVDIGGGDDSTEAFTTNLCDAVNFAVMQAGTQPLVVNMSLGEHSGPHDGTSLASRCLDNLVRDQPGRILVAAAGNEGAGSQNRNPFDRMNLVPTRLHAMGTASMQPDNLPFILHGDGNGAAQVTEGDVWTAANVNLRMTILARDAAGNFVESGVFDGTMNLEEMLAPNIGPVGIARQMRPNGQVRYRFAVADMDGDNTESTLVFWLRILGDGPFHAWIDTTSSGGFVEDPAAMTRATLDNTFAIGYPGIASQVIAVGSLGNRSTWPLAAGGMNTSDVTVVGGVSAFSSRGPSRDPMVTGQKPWILAPGEHVISAMSFDATEAALAEQAVVGGLMTRNSYVVQEGTSMASPAVAGIVALMLEANPRLTLTDVRRILRETANTEGLNQLPSIEAGHGRVDALAAVAAAAQTVANPADAGVVGGADAGSTDAGTGDGGGGCTATSGAAEGGSVLLLILALGAVRRRRR